MMKRLIYGCMIFGIILASLLSGCGGGTKTNTNPQPPQVYVGGFVTDGTNCTPCYWVGTSQIDLPGVSIDSNVESIFVSDKVYTAGYYYKTENCVPCYWIGNEQYDLGVASGNVGYAESIFVSGSTVYVAGYYTNGGSKTPCYWVNGSRQDLTIPSSIPDVSDAWATGIYVYEGTIYIAGTSSSGYKDYPTLWSGTDPLTTDGTILPNTNGGGADGIFVNASGTVFIAGCDRNPANTPCYWQDGTKYALSIPDSDSNVIASDIYVTDSGTVFTSGYGSYPYYWTGQTTSTKLQQPANTSGACAESIFAADNIVYTAGSYHDDIQNKFIACYWQGTALVQLSSEMSSGYASSIFVK